MLKIQKNKDYILLVMIHILSYGVLLLNKGIFWDDWVWLSRDLEFFSELGSQMGSMWFHNWLYFAYSNVYLSKVVIFLVLFANIIFIYKIAKHHFSSNNALILAILFSVLPFNYAKTMLCISQYSISLFMFYAAFYLVVLNIEKKSLLYRIASLILFFLSFDMNSLLFYYILVALYVWWRELKFKKILTIVTKYWDYIAIILLFVVVNKIFFVPNGSYEGYNSFSIVTLAEVPVKLPQTIYVFTVELFHEMITQGLKNPMILIIFPLIYKLIPGINVRKNKKGLVWISLVILAAALFPYIVVGKTPTLHTWNNRHSILLDLGAALLILSLLDHLCRTKHGELFSKIILSAIVSTAVLYNFTVNMDLLNQNHKQKAVQFLMGDSEVIRDNSTFLFVDETDDEYLNILDGKINRFYVFNSMLYAEFGDETRFAVPNLEQYEKNKDIAKDKPHLRFSEWEKQPITKKVILTNKTEYRLKKTISFTLFSFISKKRYEQSLKSFYQLDYEDF